MNLLKQFETKVFDKINPAVSFSVRRYVMAIGIFVAIVAFGIISMFSLGVDLLPTVVSPVAFISTNYSGASPAVVDQQITQVIENSIATLNGITDINSNSSLGVSRIQVSFDPSVDKTYTMNQLTSLVNSSIRRLPANLSSTPVVRTFDQSAQPVLQFGIDGSGAPLSEVAEYLENTLSPLMERIPGVANITLSGAPSRTFKVLLDPAKLQYYNATPTQVVNAITASAINQPIGTIVTNGSNLSFTTNNQPENLEQIRRILVDANRGITVADLGSVRDTPKNNDIARINGIPVVLASLQRTNDSNAISVVDSVKSLLAKAKLPPGYRLVFSNDTTGPIRASVESAYRELLLTLLVVALIILMFIGKPNTAFSVILAIPIALSASPILYNLAGFSLNLVSILAMIIAIGIVVDDSIVVAENVDRYRAMGYTLKESVLRGASEVFSAIVAASLSLLVVLIPVSLMNNFVGRYLQQFSLGLAAAVLFSLLEAILFLTVRMAYTPEGEVRGWRDFGRGFARFPQALKWGFKAWRSGIGILSLLAGAVAIGNFLSPIWLVSLVGYPLVLGILNYVLTLVMIVIEIITKFLHGITEAVLGAIRDAYARFLPVVLKHGVWILAGAAVFLAIIIALVAIIKIPFNIIPAADGGTISVSLRFPAGTSQDTMNKLSQRVEEFLSAQKEVVLTQARIDNSVDILGQLTPVGQRANITDLAANYRKALMPLIKDLPSVRLSVSAGGSFGGFGAGLQFSLVAADFNALLTSNSAIIQAIQENPWVADVNSSLSDRVLENYFQPDPQKFQGTGLTVQAIANILQTYTSGVQASNLVSGGLAYPIMVGIDPTRLVDSQTLLDLPVYSSTMQTNLQIGQLGSFVLHETPTAISRYNRQYTGQLTINLKPGAPTPLEMQTMFTADLGKRGLIGNGIDLNPSSRFSQIALTNQLIDTGKWLFLLSLFLAYLVMAAQFNSWRYPLYLLLPVPLAIVGALILVWIVGGGIDIFGLMGMLMLIGLSAKNAILYLDFVVDRLQLMPIKEALIEAAKLRFRPIIMTTLTVLVISFPLILSGGQGAEFGQRMGIVMLGGIVLSAALTFFVVPAAFYIFERNRVNTSAENQ